VIIILLSSIKKRQRYHFKRKFYKQPLCFLENAKAVKCEEPFFIIVLIKNIHIVCDQGADVRTTIVAFQQRLLLNLNLNLFSYNFIADSIRLFLIF
jgi:hypothetical protein